MLQASILSHFLQRRWRRNWKRRESARPRSGAPWSCPIPSWDHSDARPYVKLFADVALHLVGCVAQR